jgi:N-methylhydantoinase A
VTDANVVLGYMNPDAIAGATLAIDRRAAWTAIEQKIARPLNVEVLAAAYGITQVANATMMRALRAVSTERGRDPRDFTLIAFGGAGPIHAAALADSLSMTRVQIPLYPGLFSALGLLLADYRHDYIRSVAVTLDQLDPQAVLRHYQELETQARAELAEEGIAADQIRFERQVDLKYGYQVAELSLPFPDGSSADLQNRLAQLFTEAHRQAFGYDRADTIELVSVRLQAVASSGHLRFSELTGTGNEGAPPPSPSRTAYFGPQAGECEAAVYQRTALEQARSGPLIVEEPDTTVVVPPGWTVQYDVSGNLLLQHE